MEKDTLSDIIKRPEKLSSAVYLITNFFGDLEPLKWKLRALASDLVTYSVDIKDDFYSGRNNSNFEIRRTVREMQSQLLIAKNAGLVSGANHELLAGEFSKLLDLLGFPTGLEDSDRGTMLSQEFFKVEKGIEAPKPELKQDPEVKDKFEEKRIEYLPRLEEVRSLKSDSKGHKKSLREFGAVSVKKNSRQSVIIGLLKRKKEIMIKDVSPLISGCSEKTIQRELLAMVASGILKKEGEKRWSRYSLADGQI